jgi:hypothetical protein
MFRDVFLIRYSLVSACPVGCSSCVIPNLFTATGVTTLFEPVCDACTDGYLFQNGACVTRCADGTYASEKGTCERE